MKLQDSMICIAGKNDIAVNSLKYILDKKIVPREQIVVVCNQTENGQDTWQLSLRKFAKKNNIREVTLEELYNLDNLLFLSLEFDKIVKPEKFISESLYNIHFSLLPAYKGVYTSVWPILNGENETGVTFHRIAKGIDTGDIIFQRKISIDYDATARDVYLKCISRGTQVVCEMIAKMQQSGTVLIGKRQPCYGSSYYGKDSIDYNNLVVNLKNTAINIHNQVRAYHFKEYQIPKIYGHEINRVEILSSQSSLPSGTIIQENLDSMVIATIDYDIKILFEKNFGDI